jgi:outer membrane protein assembly factor BamD
MILPLIISGCASSKKAEAPPDPAILYKEAEERLKKGSYEEAREALQKVMERDAEKIYSPIAQIRTGDSYYDEARYNEAIDEYKRFLNLYPHNKYAGYVQYQIGMSHFRQIEGIDRGHEHLEGALKEFEAFIKGYPRHPFVDEAKERLSKCRDMAAEYEFYIGNFYFKKDSYNAAVSRFENLIKKYPQSSWEAEALYHLGLSYKELGNIEKTKDTLTRLTNHYPNYKHKEDAEKILSKLEGKK